MATLHENRLLFNSNVTVPHSGGNLSSDSGLILAKELMDKFEFGRILRKNIQIQDDRLYYIHENESILEQIILQLIAGYPTDSSANILATDPIFQTVLNKTRLASQPSISRFWDRMTTENIVQLQKVNQILIDKARTIRNTNEMIFDLDSTHSDTFGNQEMTNCNAHYQTTGYHPLVAFDGLTGDFLKAELRPGNVYTSKDVAAFTRQLFEHYQSVTPVRTIMVRADSGFATPDLYQLCEEYDSLYTIRLFLFKIAGKMVHSGRRDYLKLSSFHVYQKLFYRILQNIQVIQC